MITKIKIENFKSISSLELDLGRLNIFIGANGSGKSNILEGIVFGCAAASGKLQDEYLSNRGLRTTDSKLFQSGFNHVVEDIKVFFKGEDNESYKYIIQNEASSWRVDTNGEFLEGVLDATKKNFDTYVKDLYRQVHPKLSEPDFEKVSQYFIANLISSEFVDKYGIEKFIIFAPENHFLRRFEEEASIKPLGIRGEGFFNHIVKLITEKPHLFEKLKQLISLIDWYEDINIPIDRMFTEMRMDFKDRFLKEGITSFDQRSVNEGTLYLMFYFSIFISDYTPKFFAIDNIDNAMNPKLGSELIRILAKLAEEHGKQVILTTHNPAILDGLDLSDDNQRLFVISRNKSGHTQALRVPHKESEERLSTKFIRGSIGGLPKNF